MSSTARKKVLLMGKSGSGKTSMRSVIFSNYSAKDTKRLGATIDVEHSANLWDCGGQEAFLDNYVTAQKDTIFSNVAVLIYVFDITSNEWEKDLGYFEDQLSALRENSSDAGVWVLINKMDLMDKDDPKRRRYGERKREIEEVDERLKTDKQRGTLRCFPTSIWDESLYKAWSSVIHTLIPNINLITSHLTYVRDLCLATEAVIFESETFLVIAKSGSPLDSEAGDYDKVEMAGGAKCLDPQRFEKISEIVKGFRKTCLKTGEQYVGMECKFEDCTVVLEPVTKNTVMLIVSVDKRSTTAMITRNIHQCQIHLAEIGVRQTITRKCGCVFPVGREDDHAHAPHRICRHSAEITYNVKGDDDDATQDWDVKIEDDEKIDGDTS
ncbi:Ras-related GTP-binding protein A/B, partial [Tremellales sp. Uapishka_1]